MLRRIAIAVALLVAIPLVVIPCWIATHRTDLASLDDSDLAATRPPLMSGTNGFDHFVAASERLAWPSDADDRLKAIRAGQSSDPTWVREMLAKNAPALAALRRGLDSADFQLPASDSGSRIDPAFEAFMSVQRLLKLVGADARIRLARGDQLGAIEHGLLGMRVGRKLSGAEGINLLGMMFATSEQGISIADLEPIVREARLDSGSAHALVSRLRAERWTPDDWSRMWAGEYRFIRSSLLEIRLDDAQMSSTDEHGTAMEWAWKLIPADYLFQPIRTIARVADQYRGRQQRSALACRDAYGPPPSRDERQLRLAKAIVSPNPVGGIILEIATPNFDRFDQKRCLLETKIALLETLIGAKAYWDANDRLPERLEDLVPTYLPEMPQDRFAGAPLRYAPDRKLAYSLGDDFVDAGGAEPADASHLPEPSISLAFSSSRSARRRRGRFSRPCRASPRA
ncbi:MAG TPA: hypothetical protein VII72_15780 [Myxococcota bacterium]